MKVYVVTEYICGDFEENATGIYSTIEKAKEAIWNRVKQEYTPDELVDVHFDKYNTLITPENEWIASCRYDIDEFELDKEMG